MGKPGPGLHRQLGGGARGPTVSELVGGSDGSLAWRRPHRVERNLSAGGWRRIHRRANRRSGARRHGRNGIARSPADGAAGGGMPDSLVDGQPASSKFDLFEAMLENILDKLKAHPDLFKETAFFITLDEGGGYWDSGFFQPLDFFGDGPRIPLVVISPFSQGGKVVHSYNDHASIVKFIERNWGLKPLTRRSRDNLPNSRLSCANRVYDRIKSQKDGERSVK